MPPPLAAFPIVSTNDVEKAQSILSHEMASLSFRRVHDRDHFQLIMNGAHLGKTMVGYNRFGVETEIDGGQIEEAVIFSICIGTPTIVELDGVPNAPNLGSIVSPPRHLRVHRKPESEILILRTSIHAIEERFQEVMGWPITHPIRFEKSVDLTSGLGAEVKRLVHFVVDQANREGSALEHPLLRTSLDDLLTSAMLSLPSNVSESIVTCRGVQPVPGILRRAEEYLEANAAEPISISDVVEVCGCSRRALFLAFRRYRDCTPMEFLSYCRLGLARLALQAPAPGDSVASIAYACGFLHRGRFSQRYLQRFGESPSETLRRSRPNNFHA